LTTALLVLLTSYITPDEYLFGGDLNGDMSPVEVPDDNTAGNGAEDSSTVPGTPDPVSTDDPNVNHNPDDDIIVDPDDGIDWMYNDRPNNQPPLEFRPYYIEETHPDKMLKSTAIMANGEIVNSFSFDKRIDFGFGDSYTQFDGISTFRGNNFRDTGSFGRADIQNAKFREAWRVNTGSLVAPDGAVWTGHGWTGQTLISKWPIETRKVMTNMYEWAREQEELIEIIYPAMDGFVYFNELETGKATRDKLNLGFTFKGSGAIDPRGYPLLYVGAGYDSAKGSARIFIVNLLDGSVLMTFGNGDAFAPRNWPMADVSPLIDAETDKLLYPSENGVLYIVELNSNFDQEAGIMTIDPSPLYKWRFVGHRSHVNSMYWLGFESSPVIWRGHMFLGDNGGHFVCIDLNTLEAVWVLDNIDDTNCSPVLAIEDGHPYIYLSMAFHGNGWRAPADSSAVVPIRKIDAQTGEIIWSTEYYCYTARALSGGVQGTLALGKHQLRDLIFVPIARAPTRGAGILAALNRYTGEVIWEFQTANFSWSSPVCVYDSDGRGYVIYCCTIGGNMYLLNGLTGELLDTIHLGGTVEASPAVYNNMIVIGTRAQRIWGIELT
jgi:outer membrane protein assembly factor BamB